MSREGDLRTALRELEVPEHAPGFWAEWEDRLSQPPGRPRRKVALGAAAALAVAVVVALVLISTPPALTPRVLAYSFPEGVAFRYEVEYRGTNETTAEGEGPVEPGEPTSFEFEGLVTYVVEPGPDPDTVVVAVEILVCRDPAGCEAEDALVERFPEHRLVVDRQGGFVRSLSPAPASPIPVYVLPVPDPYHLRHGARMPFGLGPPFPERPLAVGDSWTTGEYGPQVTARHRIVREEQVAGRRTLVIESIYRVPAFEVHEGVTAGPHLIDVTVWFDPLDGIVVRAEMEGTMASSGRSLGGELHHTGTRHFTAQLISDSG